MLKIRMLYRSRFFCDKNFAKISLGIKIVWKLIAYVPKKRLFIYILIKKCTLRSFSPESCRSYIDCTLGNNHLSSFLKNNSTAKICFRWKFDPTLAQNDIALNPNHSIKGECKKRTILDNKTFVIFPAK